MIGNNVEAYDNMEWEEIRKGNSDKLTDLLVGAKVIEINTIEADREHARDDELGGVDITLELKDGKIYVLSIFSTFGIMENAERVFVEIAQLIL